MTTPSWWPWSPGRALKTWICVGAHRDGNKHAPEADLKQTFSFILASYSSPYGLTGLISPHALCKAFCEVGLDGCKVNKHDCYSSLANHERKPEKQVVLPILTRLINKLVIEHSSCAITGRPFYLKLWLPDKRRSKSNFELYVDSCYTRQLIPNSAF